MPLSSDVEAIEKSFKDVGVQLQKTEQVLTDLQTSMNDHIVTMQDLRTSLKGNISTEGHKFLDAQQGFLLAIMAAIRISRSEASDNLGRLG